jgi:pyrophosphatase PpaX
VLFDLDGTICNSIDVIVASYERAFREVSGRRIALSDALGWIGEPLPVTFRREDPANADRLERAYRQFNESHMADMILPYPGIPELLDDLNRAGVAMGVVTSKRKVQAQDSMIYAGISGRIPLLVSMESTTIHKPKPEPLLLALQMMHGHADRACYVGDAVVDLEAARAAGLARIGVTWGAGAEPDLAAQHPDQLCHTVAELRSALLAG